MTSHCAPVFLGSSSDEGRRIVRSALAAHPRFFTSHLPADDEASVVGWAEAMGAAAFARRPVWLSEAAFGCMEALTRSLPEARFVRVGRHPTRVSEALLELDDDDLRADPTAAIDRILGFLGEQVTTRVGMQRCA